MENRTVLRYGMVGGSLTSFIGNVHRRAIAFERDVELVAGCFSTNPASNRETGEAYHLSPDRVYASYEEMARLESEREDRIDFVDVVTPNNVHFDIVKAFLTYGFHVVCEKPLCLEIEQAAELEKLAAEKNVLFAVTYAYTGYSMAKFARQLIAEGKIGKVFNVRAEYLQDWLLGQIGEDGDSEGMLSAWRVNPVYAGRSNCVGDIGTHIESMVNYMTGLEIERVSARINRFGHPLDLDANMQVEFKGGACGQYSCSQVSAGYNNGLTVRIFGTKGAIEWRQENPDDLRVVIKGQPVQLYQRGTDHVYGRGAALSRIPSGHPEGYYVAFANLFQIYTGALRKRLTGQELTREDLDFPGIREGVTGTRFIHAVIESGDNDSAWVKV
jgi:predicted dehydrogenase